ncbi:MAG TPA: hypothetical protein VFU22_34155, partial [Roseiflexaceae bacterium]|nr:hypothetical protein [Roseiflexaceae bacterium]
QLRHPKLPDNLNPYTQILSAHGALNPIDAGDVAIMFLKQIQQHDRPADEREWVTLGSPPLWEHAIWIDAPLLKGILGDVLDATNTSIAFKKAPLDISRTRRAKTVLRRSGHVVALLDQDRVFKDLVDRQALLERVATVAGEITDGV